MRVSTETKGTPSQLPVSSYFDPALYQREMQTIFQNGPRYVGHSLSVPNIGDYYALPQEQEGRALVRNAGGVELISNVCRHRQALMLKGRDSLINPATDNGRLVASAGGNIVCPLHRWTYSGANTNGVSVPSGTLIGAPHFDQDPCLNLKNYPLQEWNGLLFEGNGRNVAADLSGMGPRAALDFDGFVLDKVVMHECNYNWKTFIEVYLEDYHVGPFHPGLGKFVTCDDLSWQFADNYSVQTVGVAAQLAKADATGGSAVY
ncbi:MAG: aromatic ring-hydroxylating dioxygenase subunit alpha, partial [Rhodoferax sp.]